MKKTVLIVLIISLVLVLALVSTIKLPQLISGPTDTANPTPMPSPSAVTPNSTGLPLIFPDGFQIYTYAKDLGAPRDLLWVENTLLASLPDRGQVVALVDSHQNGWSDKTQIVISKLNRPHGLAFKNNELFVAETDKVSVYKYDSETHEATFIKTLFPLSGGGNHWTRSLLIKDDLLYVATGSSCNVCNESDLRRSTVQVANLDGTNLRTFSSGLRNAPFLTLHPTTKKIWVTEMGRDNLGDDLPPDEINILEDGFDYGWPYCYGKNIHDSKFDSAKYKAPDICNFLNKTASHIDLPAHSAPLGLAFVPASWPKEYAGNLLVALHGSWNRSEPTGYKIIRIKFDLTQNPLGQLDFVSGWLDSSGKKLGRPVDLEFNPAGDLFISDDQSGNIYLVKPTSVVK